MSYRLGVRVHREQAPETVIEYVRLIEELGFDDAWVVEDLAFAAGLTAAAAALASTGRLQVGIGILAAVVRNPAFLAMELATVDRMFPGRLVAGVGHGVQSWMGDVGVRAASPLTALRETLGALEHILDGEPATVDGRYVRLDGIRLVFPPDRRPPILAGVRGPKSLALAGAHCDGAVLAEPVVPGYLRWVRELLDPAAADAGRARPQVAAYTWLSVDDDTRAAQERLRPALAANLADPDSHANLRGLPFAEELSARLTAGGGAEAIEPEWVSRLGIVGTPAECAASIAQLAAAGADRIILLPPPGEEAAQLQTFAAQVKPLR
ncbi:MAG TPA: LLM class flavin-dependent oxidoreductase [Actinocrinis sp.]|nr:LLM class flavin-dependent oxidoreductase [Actinocrinis sp.]